MSTIKVNTIKDTSGTEVYTAKAWVNFNGTGTVAIRAAGNVSSITDNGTGDYTVNFTTAMSDTNYSAVASCGRDTASGGSGEGAFLIEVNQSPSPTVNSVQVSGYNYLFSKADSRIVSVTIFR